MNVLFSRTAWEQYNRWQSEDDKIVKRIHELIKAIQKNPYKGIGKPELLSNDERIKYHFPLILLSSDFVKKPRCSIGYSYVFCLV